MLLSSEVHINLTMMYTGINSKVFQRNAMCKYTDVYSNANWI